MKILLMTAALLAAYIQTSAAATLVVPDLTVLSTDTVSGPTFVVPTNYSASDFLSFTVSGIVTLQGGATYGTNAAGVVVVPGSTGIGGSSFNGSGLSTFGSLLLGNGSIPFVQLFPTNPANGVGSGAPPTTLVFSETLGSIFGTGLSSGTVLQFRVSDTNTADNSGQFSITSSAVPEPGTWFLAASGLMLVATRRLHKR
jgi:hypothetical protein